MRVTLLGTGTPTNPHRFQSAVLIEIGNHKLLFDTGRGAVHQLYQAGVNVALVNPVFITHHHFDHINDLFDVIISSAMQGRNHTLDIYGPLGTRKIVFALLEQVYAQDIRFRIEEDKEIRRRGGTWQERPEAITQVAVQDVEPGRIAEKDGWQVFADYVLHGAFAHAPDFEWHCLGYRLQAEGKTIAISGDTVACEGLNNLAQGADLLIQCCHFPHKLVNNPVTEYLTTSILPSSRQVGTIAAEANVKRLVLTHLSASISKANETEILEDVRQDYQGEILIGHDLLQIEM